MEQDYIPTKNDGQYYANALQRFLARADVSGRNKELVSTYLRDAALGRTVRGRAKTKIGCGRRTSYLTSLETLINFVRKDLDQVQDADMQLFIEALEGGRIRSRKRFMRGRGYFVTGAPLSPRYIVDVKVNIRRYYKYLLGNSQVYPPLVDWIDVSHKPREIPALTEDEVRQMVDRAGTTRDRALIQVLFDGGFRLGELLNIRLQNVTLRELEQGHKCFLLRAPYSKTLPRTVVLPMPESTKWLSYWLQEHPAGPVVNADGTLAAEDVAMQLFPMRAGDIEAVCTKLSAAALGKHVWPHLLRHTSATYWANKLSYFKFCKRFGWTMTSKMPQRYIDAAGVDELDTARIYRESMATHGIPPVRQPEITRGPPTQLTTAPASVEALQELGAALLQEARRLSANRITEENAVPVAPGMGRAEVRDLMMQRQPSTSAGQFMLRRGIEEAAC